MYKTILLVSLSLLVLSCSSKKDSKNLNNKGKQLTIPAKAIIIQPRNLAFTIHSNGTILANEEVELRSEAVGRITNIYFKEGQSVSKGKLLLKIEDSDLKAQFNKIQLQIELANADENRSQILLEQKAISQQDYDIALNKLNSLKADADFIQAQLRKTSVIAPFSGTIGFRYVSEGSYVSSATLLASLQQTDPIKIEFSVPDRYANYIVPGVQVNLITNLEKQYSALVYASDQKIDINTRSLKVRAQRSNSRQELIPGSFVKVESKLSPINNALIVPAEAIIPVLAGQTVYLYKNGKAAIAKVTTGIRTDSEVQILSGLNAGDTVITTGIMMLRDGAKVQLQSVSNN